MSTTRAYGFTRCAHVHIQLCDVDADTCVLLAEQCDSLKTVTDNPRPRLPIRHTITRSCHRVNRADGHNIRDFFPAASFETSPSSGQSGSRPLRRNKFAEV